MLHGGWWGVFRDLGRFWLFLRQAVPRLEGAEFETIGAWMMVAFDRDDGPVGGLGRLRA